MSRSRSTEGDVGYGRPPTHAQFKPGQSGNPRGRPKGARNLRMIFDDVLNQTVVVTDARGRRKVSKSELIITQCVNKAAAGDSRSIETILKTMGAGIPNREEAATEPVFGSKEDAAMLEEVLQQASNRHDGGVS